MIDWLANVVEVHIEIDEWIERSGREIQSHRRGDPTTEYSVTVRCIVSIDFPNPSKETKGFNFCPFIWSVGLLGHTLFPCPWILRWLCWCVVREREILWSEVRRDSWLRPMAKRVPFWARIEHVCCSVSRWSHVSTGDSVVRRSILQNVTLIPEESDSNNHWTFEDPDLALWHCWSWRSHHLFSSLQDSTDRIDLVGRLHWSGRSARQTLSMNVHRRSRYPSWSLTRSKQSDRSLFVQGKQTNRSKRQTSKDQIRRMLVYLPVSEVCLSDQLEIECHRSRGNKGNARRHRCPIDQPHILTGHSLLLFFG